MGMFGEKVGLYFSRGVGEGEKKRLLSLFPRPQKSKFGRIPNKKHLVKLIFSAKTEISGENFSRAEEKNTPKKVVFSPKVAGSDEKGRFWGENYKEGIKRKNGLYYRFCHAMK